MRPEAARAASLPARRQVECAFRHELCVVTTVRYPFSPGARMMISDGNV